MFNGSMVGLVWSTFDQELPLLMFQASLGEYAPSQDEFLSNEKF